MIFWTQRYEHCIEIYKLFLGPLTRAVALLLLLYRKEMESRPACVYSGRGRVYYRHYKCISVTLPEAVAELPLKWEGDLLSRCIYEISHARSI